MNTTTIQKNLRKKYDIKRSRLSKNKKLQIAAAVLAVFIVTAGGIYAYHSLHKVKGLEYENNATIGTLPGIDIEQRQEELQQQLDESQTAFSINTNTVFASGTAQGNIMLENPAQNAKLLTAEIYLTDTNEQIYKSKALKPGTYLETIKLDKVLDAGVYSAVVYFKSYRQDTQEYLGQTGASITITVES